MPVLFNAAILSAMLASSIPCQVSAVRASSPAEGAPLPFDSAALSRSAMPPGTNPAALAGTRGLSLTYLHDRNTNLSRTSDAVFASAGIGVLSLGFSEQWIRYGGGWPQENAVQPDHRKTTLSLALGGETAGLGASLSFFNAKESRDLNRMAAVDIGAFVRPIDFLSVGAAAFDLNAPDFGGGRLPRRFDIGVGFRPGTDRAEIGADWLFDDLSPMKKSRLALSIRGEVAEGIVLTASVSSTVQGDDIAGQVGLAIRTDHFGAGYAFGSGISKSSVDPASHTAWITASSQSMRGIASAPKGYAVLDVESFLHAGSGLGSIQQLLFGEEDGWLGLMAALRHVEESETLTGLVIKLEGSGELGMAHAEELAAQIQRIRQRGKKTAALLLGASDADYLVAAACDKITVVPAADLFINGFAFSNIFAGRLLEKVGVTMDVARSGKYKTAPEQFTRSSMSDEEREQLTACLDTIYPRYIRAVASARRLSEDQVRAIIDTGILTASAAKEKGLVDEIIEGDQLPAFIASLEGKPAALSPVPSERPDIPVRWGKTPKIALIRISGLITGGESSGGLLERRKTGAADTIRAIQSAWADSGVKAIVLAIDSGGGSSMASDLIWRTVRLAARNKPVVVSLGDVAASGGYYIASAGTEIFTSPSTLTGSIGVFIAKPAFRRLMEKIGVSSDSITRGKSAELMSLEHPWNYTEAQAVQAAVNNAYSLFLDRVAEGRGMKRKDVEALAEGRVWLGSDAVKNGLADSIGGLSEAIQRAKVLAGLAPSDEAEVIALTGSTLSKRTAAIISSALGDEGPKNSAILKLLHEADSGMTDFLSEELGTPLALTEWIFR